MTDFSDLHIIVVRKIAPKTWVYDVYTLESKEIRRVEARAATRESRRRIAARRSGLLVDDYVPYVEVLTVLGPVTLEDKQRARYRAWYAKNKERVAKSKREWHLRNPGKSEEYKQRAKEKDPERYLKWRRKARKNWRVKNHEKYSESRKATRIRRVKRLLVKDYLPALRAEIASLKKIRSLEIRLESPTRVLDYHIFSNLDGIMRNYGEGGKKRGMYVNRAKWIQFLQSVLKTGSQRQRLGASKYKVVADV